MQDLRTEKSAWIEIGLLFLPAIPALLWVWPSLHDESLIYLVQSLAYVYFFCGSLVIGLRRWTWAELGLNWQGVGLGLVCGGIIVIERFLAQIAFGFPLEFRAIDPVRLILEIGFYFGLVGLVEETLFRGLIFQILESRHGAGLAIFGSALGFALWHIGWAGSLMVGHFLIGIVFGLVRWRARGLGGLVLVHGLFDVIGVEMPFPIAMSGIEQALGLTVVNVWAVIVGDALLVGLVAYLWLARPRLHWRKQRWGS